MGLGHVTGEHGVGRGADQRGDAADAGRVGDAEQQRGGEGVDRRRLPRSTGSVFGHGYQ